MKKHMKFHATNNMNSYPERILMTKSTGENVHEKTSKEWKPNLIKILIV